MARKNWAYAQLRIFSGDLSSRATCTPEALPSLHPVVRGDTTEASSALWLVLTSAQFGTDEEKEAPYDLRYKMTFYHPASPSIMLVCRSLLKSCTTCISVAQKSSRGGRRTLSPRICKTHKGGLVQGKAVPMVPLPFSKTRRESR